MAKLRTTEPLFIVVEVAAGVAVEVAPFHDIRLARDYVRTLCHQRDLEEDDVQIFRYTFGGSASHGMCEAMAVK